MSERRRISAIFVLAVASLLLAATEPGRASTIAMPVAPAADTWLDTGASGGHGDSATLLAGNAGGSAQWTLVRFDLPPQPAGSTLAGATLSLTIAAPPAESILITATRLTAYWDESISDAGSLAMASLSTATAGVSSAASAGSIAEWDVAPDVAAAYAGESALYGWVLRGPDGPDDPAATVQFSSREATGGAPQLTLVFESSSGPVTTILSAPGGSVRGPATIVAELRATGGDSITGAEYTLDAATAAGGGIALQPADAFDSAVETAALTLDACTLGDGARQIHIRGRDSGGDWGALTAASIVVDCTAPAPPVIDALPPRLDRASIVITGTSEPGTTVWLEGTLVAEPGDSGQWSHVAALEPGPNTFRFTAHDAAGNESTPATITIERGDTALFVTVEPVQSPTRDSRAVLHGRSSAVGQVRVNGAEATHGRDRWSHIIDLDEGANAIRIEIEDGGDRGRRIDLTIVRDSHAPTSPKRLSTTPPRDDCTLTTSVLAEWEAASDSGTGVAEYRYTWDRAPESDVVGGRGATATSIREELAPGEWYVHVVAVDAAGNTSPPRHYGPVCLEGEGGAIEGAVFVDADGDGRYAFGDEPGLAEWRVATGAGDAGRSALTDDDGAYRLAAPIGSHAVCVATPSRYETPWYAAPGTPTSDGVACRSVEIASATASGFADFGFYRLSVLHGRVFADTDGDGRADAAESPLEGVAVTATNGRGETTGALAGAGGGYELVLAPGEYLVCAEAPRGFAPSAPASDRGCWAIAIRSGHDVPGPDFGFAAR